jgi:serine/threonine protein phosphatase PrpC
MGTYLSTPVTDKCEESGEHLDCPEVPCSWGVVDMQGWRKSMEDSHIAVTDISLAPNDDDDDAADETKECHHISDAKVFGVFDGHGGAEVARLCSLYMVSVLTQQPTWKEGVPNTIETGVEDAGETKVGKALRSAFHALDRMVDDLARR